MSDLKCVWYIGGTKCDGKVETLKLFSNQLSIPICKNHLVAHKEIMALNKAGYETEEILEMSIEERKQEIVKQAIDLDAVSI